MGWIESHTTLATHRKTRRLSRALSLPIPAVMGHLHCLWHWATNHAPEGDLSKFDADDIAFAAMFRGEDYEQYQLTEDDFLKALIETGWIDETESGRRLHNWEQYAGGLIEYTRQASEAGARGNHERWHVKKGVTNPNCKFCRGDDGGDSGPDSGATEDPTPPESLHTVPAPDLTEPKNTKPEPENLAPKSARERDELFEATAEVCGIDWQRDLTDHARGPLNTAVKQLREVGATPAEVRRRAQNWPGLFERATLTPPALAKHWPQLERAKPPPEPRDRFMDIARSLHAEEAPDGFVDTTASSTRRGLPQG